jgi:hypothetical protein
MQERIMNRNTEPKISVVELLCKAFLFVFIVIAAMLGINTKGFLRGIGQ